MVTSLIPLQAKVRELEVKEPRRIGFGKWKKVVELHAFFAQQYNPEEFETIFTWLKNWIWIEKSENQVKLWAHCKFSDFLDMDWTFV